MKKRTNIVVDDQLLEDARRATGEKTYSGAITKALERVVRRQTLDEAIARIQERGDPFDPQYVAMMWPHLAEPKRRTRVSADEKRAPQKKSSRRGSR